MSEFLTSAIFIGFLIVATILPVFLLQAKMGHLYTLVGGFGVVAGLSFFLWEPGVLFKLSSDILGLSSLIGVYYFVSGGIRLETKLQGSPGFNTVFLVIASASATILGAPGATFVFARPFFQANSFRRKTNHLVVFFVLIVTTTGGLISPLSQPHMYLTYLRGLGMQEFIRFLPIWLFILISFAAIFYVVDILQFNTEAIHTYESANLANDLHRAMQKQVVPQSLVIRTINYLETPILKITGSFNLLLLMFLPIIVYYGNELNRYYHLREILIICVSIVAFFTGKIGDRENSGEHLKEFSRMLSIYIILFIIYSSFTLLYQQFDANILNFYSENLTFISGVLSIFSDNTMVTILNLRPDMMTGDFHLYNSSGGGSNFLNMPISNEDLHMNDIIGLLSIITIFGGLLYSGNLFNFYAKREGLRAGLMVPGNALFLAISIVPILLIVLTILTGYIL